MVGWTDGWINGWMDGWTMDFGRMDDGFWMDGRWIKGWMDDGWIDGRMDDGWINGWTMDGWMMDGGQCSVINLAAFGFLEGWILMRNENHMGQCHFRGLSA